MIQGCCYAESNQQPGPDYGRCTAMEVLFGDILLLVAPFLNMYPHTNETALTDVTGALCFC